MKDLAISIFERDTNMNFLYKILFLLAGFSEQLGNLFYTSFFIFNPFLLIFIILLFLCTLAKKKIRPIDVIIIIITLCIAIYYGSSAIMIFSISYYIAISQINLIVRAQQYYTIMQQYCIIVFIIQFLYFFYFDNITLGENGYELQESNRSRYGILGANSLAIVMLFFNLGYFQPIREKVFLSTLSIATILTTSNKFSLIILLLKSVTSYKSLIIFPIIFITIIILGLEEHFIARFTTFEDLERLDKILNYIELVTNYPIYLIVGFGDNYDYINSLYKFSDNSIIELATYSGLLFSILFHFFLLRNLNTYFTKNYRYLFYIFILTLQIFNILLWLGPFFLIIESFRYLKYKNEILKNES